MSNQHPEIDPKLAEWIREQHVFFVASAPLSAEGHVNTSPKGGDALRILGPMEAVYQDHTGSGAETAAHIQENGRIVIMFCAFTGPPKIARLHGKGTLITRGHTRFEELDALFPMNAGTRAYVHIAVTRVSTSCGMSVPFFDFKEDRDALDRWAEKQGPEKMEAYRASKNVLSIDHLAAFEARKSE